MCVAGLYYCWLGWLSIGRRRFKSLATQFTKTKYAELSVKFLQRFSHNFLAIQIMFATRKFFLVLLNSDEKLNKSHQTWNMIVLLKLKKIVQKGVLNRRHNRVKPFLMYLISAHIISAEATLFWIWKLVQIQIDATIFPFFP